MSSAWILRIEQQWTQMSKYLCSKSFLFSDFYFIFGVFLPVWLPVHRVYVVSTEATGGIRFSNSSHRWWVLGIESRSSERAPSALSPRAISPDLFVLSWVLMLNHSNDKCPAFCPKCLACLCNSDHLSVVGLKIRCLLSYLFMPSCPLRQQ